MPMVAALWSHLRTLQTPTAPSVISGPRLAAKAPLEQLEEAGYEQLRSPDAVKSDNIFCFDFEMHSAEHRTWLEAAGTI